MWRLIYLIQIAGGGELPLPTFVPPACEKAGGDEIVVCKPRSESARYGPRLPDAGAGLLPDAEFRVFGQARLRLFGEQRGMSGFTAPAAMVSVKVPF